ncbi:MAG: glycosyltransferase, partial [Stellaceae bacterium]
MVYHGGLAALLAGVPRIVLSARSVPPIDRPDRNRPEYDIIYRSLLAANNVVLSVNSRHAATRFATWLDLDPAKIAIIPNGVTALPTAGDDDALSRYHRFDAATGPSPLTLGTVMRMDHNKRPFLWIDAAAKILLVQPKARFIMVGGGELREQAMKRVSRQGIADRFLFAGLSSCVGFWLSKMDVFLLTSIYEGLPNSLIEAQLAQVPAITTPADGALEAAIPGVSALVTTADPTPEEIAARVLVLMENTVFRRRMGEIGAGWAAEAFSVPKMLDRTLDLLGVPRGADMNMPMLAELGHDLPREATQVFDRRARVDQQDQRHAASL